MKKRILTVTLTLIMCFSLIPAKAFAFEANYRLRWDMGSTNNNPAYVEWHVDTQSLQVTYTLSGNFFHLRDATNPVMEKLLLINRDDGDDAA